MDDDEEAYHDRVNEGVEQNENPDRWRHISNTGPHAQHSTSVMVGLQETALLALRDDDQCVDHLVELGQVEQPSIVREAGVPQSSVDHAFLIQVVAYARLLQHFHHVPVGRVDVGVACDGAVGSEIADLTQ